MAAVFAGMTLLEVCDLLVALATLGLDAPKLAKLVEELKAKGHPPEQMIPPEHVTTLRAGFMEIHPATITNPLGNPDAPE
jgi:hypothetical protein